MGSVLGPDGSNLIVIGGLHRSGTTLLTRTIEAIPGTSGMRGTGSPMDEGQFVQDVFDAQIAERVGTFGFQREAHLTEADAQPDHADRLAAAWTPFWDMGARRWVKKSPPNMIRARYFATVFPGAAQIMVLRNPMIVALASQKWTGVGLYAGTDHAVHTMSLMFEDLLAIHDRWIVVRYEALVTDARRTLAGMAEVLDVDPAEIPLPKIDAGIDKAYVADFDRPIPSDKRMVRVQQLRGAARRRVGVELSMTRFDLETTLIRHGETLDRFGYSGFAAKSDAPAVLGRNEVAEIIDAAPR